MKILQNHFTTQEQSKRLLELGVPADSADCCYYVKDKCAPIEIIPPGNRDTPHTFSTYAKGYNDVFYPENPSLFAWDTVDVLPCWSVGRLIEISLICGIGDRVPNEFYINKYSLVNSLVENIICRLERVADLSVNDIDFSKLEE